MKYGIILKPVPFLMTGGLLLASITATAHHIFYNSVNQHTVQSSVQQEWFSRIGTGLAFLIKTLLTASASLAYTQMLWSTLKTKSFSLSGLDTLFAVIHDAWEFLNLETWHRSFPLITTALIIWMIPIVAVITPGTLSVQLSVHPKEDVINASIPGIAFDNYMHFAQYAGSPTTYYSAPTDRISRLMAAVTSQGSILQLPAPWPNSSYSLEFVGPSVFCSPSALANNSQLTELIRTAQVPGMAEDGIGPINYVGFVPTQFYDARDAFTATVDGLNSSLRGSSNADTPTLDSWSGDHARLFITLPNITDFSNSATYGVASKMIECGLFNSSLQVDFRFSNGQQEVKIKNRTRFNGATQQPTMWGSNHVQDAFIAMFHALNIQLVGYIAEAMGEGQMKVVQTQVLNTVFTQTPELHKLLERVNTRFAPTSSDDFAPLSIANISMAEAVEQVFDNATLSLFSDSYFLIAPEVPVNVFTPQNVYIYKPRNLLIAYCSSIAVTAIVVLVGLICVSMANSDTFDTSFSTILRTTRNPELDALVVQSATTGAKPLPKGLSEVKLRLLERYKTTGSGMDGQEENEAGLRTCFAVDDSGGSVQDQQPAEEHVEHPEVSLVDVDSLLMSDEQSQ